MAFATVILLIMAPFLIAFIFLVPSAFDEAVKELEEEVRNKERESRDKYSPRTLGDIKPYKSSFFDDYSI